MDMYCTHCQRPNPEILQTICRSCASAAFYGHVSFHTYRFLAPGERIVPGTEVRGADDWQPVAAASSRVADSEFGRFRYKLRPAGAGCRFLDPGEQVRAGDEFYTPRTWVQIYGQWPSVVGDHEAQQYRRPMYARRREVAYAERNLHDCSCANRVSLLGGDRAAECCTNCGRVWVSLLGREEPAVTMQPLKPDCRCTQVEEIDDLRVRCSECGRAWLQSEHAARYATYPDCPELDAETQTCTTSPLMREIWRSALRVMRSRFEYLRSYEPKSQELKAAHAEVLSAEACQRIERQFAELEELADMSSAQRSDRVLASNVQASVALVASLVRQLEKHLNAEVPVASTEVPEPQLSWTPRRKPPLPGLDADVIYAELSPGMEIRESDFWIDLDVDENGEPAKFCRPCVATVGALIPSVSDEAFDAQRGAPQSRQLMTGWFRIMHGPSTPTSASPALERERAAFDALSRRIEASAQAQPE